MRVVGVSGGIIDGGPRGTVKMIDGGVIRIEDLAAVQGRRVRIAVVHPDILARAALHLGHVHPDIGDAQQRIETLNAMVEDGFVVRRHEAQIRAVRFHTVETEVAGMQTHQQGNAPHLIGDGRTLLCGVQGYLLAVAPIFLPPGMGQGRQERPQAG